VGYANVGGVVDVSKMRRPDDLMIWDGGVWVAILG